MELIIGTQWISYLILQQSYDPIKAVSSPKNQNCGLWAYSQSSKPAGGCYIHIDNS